MMTTPTSPKVSIRSTLFKQTYVPAEKQMNVVRLKHGELVSADILSLGQKILNCNCDFFSVSMDLQTLVFRNRVQVNGWNVDYKLVMKACLDSHGTDRFIRAFYRNPDTKFVTTGFLVKALSRTVHDEVLKNLQFVNVARVSGPVKSAARHNCLLAACGKMGIRCLTDELTLERVS